MATAKKTIKTTKATAKSARVAHAVKSTKKVSPVVASTPAMAAVSATPMAPSKKFRLNTKVLTAAVVILAVALLTYKAGPWLVPAIVDNHPITRFALWNKLESSYGAQTLDDMTNQQVLDDAIAKSGVKIDQSAVDAQMKTLEDQFKDVGGLDTALKQRGMTRGDLQKQVYTQLAVEEILKDKVTPTDAEVQKEYDTNKDTTYKGETLDQAKTTIVDTLKQNKLQSAFLTWFADVKKNASIKTFGL